MTIARLPVLFLALLLAPAVVRGQDIVFADGFDGGPVCAPASGVRVAIAATPASRATTLGTPARYAIEVLSCGYAGTVTLGASGLPAGWSAAYPQATVTLASGQQILTELVVTVPSNSVAGAFDFAAFASITPQEVALASLALDVANVFVITHAAGTGSGPHNYPALTRLRSGATVSFRNEDVSFHAIHFDPPLSHEPPPGAPQGGSFVVVPPVGTHDFYCHNHNTGAGVGRLIVE